MKPLIIANWKANPSTLNKAKKLFEGVAAGLTKTKAEAVICPPFLYLRELANSGKIKLGAQDVFWQEGAFTGQISAKMLKDAGCSYVIIGHSERRALGETDEMVNKKMKTAIPAKLFPILCIGESKQEREEGRTKEVLERQLILGLKDISGPKLQSSRFIIAYEPIWAISTTSSHENCDFENALSIQILIKKIVLKIYNQQNFRKIRVIFGGNVNASNVLGYIEESRMGGVLVGGASLEVKRFIAILRKF